MGPTIQLRQLTVDIGTRRILESLEVTFAAGSLSAIVGANGCGKTTLLRTITGLLKPVSGSVEIKDGSGFDIGYLPQHSEVDRGFPISVYDFVAGGLWLRSRSWRGLSQRQCDAIQQALVQTGLQDMQRRPLRSLSGGQFQRMLFARLILQDTRIMLLDEPFNAVDKQTVALMLDSVKQWHREGRTVIVVSHDPLITLEHFPNALLLNGAASRYGATREVLSLPQWPDPGAVFGRRTAGAPLVDIAQCSNY